MTGWERTLALWAAAGAAAVAPACTDDLAGLDAAATPLAELRVRVTGDLEPLRPAETLKEKPRLRVGLLWGAQVQADPFCLPLPGDPSITAVRSEGCRDPFGFVGARIGPSVPVEPGQEVVLPLFDLPLADLLIGDITARLAYASVVVFDDRDDNKVLELWRATEWPTAQSMGPGKGGGSGGGMQAAPAPVPTKKADLMYAASFVSMLKPDQRLGYREGGYDPLSFYYPRWGCPEPPKGFSLLAAGGFTLQSLFALLADSTGALAAGLPGMATETCSAKGLTQAVLELPLQATETFRDVVCASRAGNGMSSGFSTNGSVTYREPPEKALPLDTIAWTCQPVAQGGKSGKAGGMAAPTQGDQAPAKPAVIELVVSGVPGGCRTVSHYIPKGCSTNPYCEEPQWEPAKPPAWWPCPLSAKGL